MKLLIKDLINGALDWAVAQCDKVEIVFDEDSKGYYPVTYSHAIGDFYHPSTNPKQGLEIIERIGISTRQIKRRPFSIMEARHFDAEKGDVIEYMADYKREMLKRPIPPTLLDNKWLAQICYHPDTRITWSKTDFPSDTLLISAMRCYVASVLGNEVEIPKGLS